MTHIKVQLRKTMKERSPGMTYAALALLAKCNPRTIRDIANGHYTRISLDILAGICVALDCQPSDILVLVDGDPAPQEDGEDDDDE